MLWSSIDHLRPCASSCQAKQGHMIPVVLLPLISALTYSPRRPTLMLPIPLFLHLVHWPRQLPGCIFQAWLGICSGCNRWASCLTQNKVAPKVLPLLLTCCWLISMSWHVLQLLLVGNNLWTQESKENTSDSSSWQLKGQSYSKSNVTAILFGRDMKCSAGLASSQVRVTAPVTWLKNVS